MTTHSNVLAWRTPGTGEPGGLPSRVAQSRTRLKRLSSSSRRVPHCPHGSAAAFVYTVLPRIQGQRAQPLRASGAGQNGKKFSFASS